jgi:hypothetical protein
LRKYQALAAANMANAAIPIAISADDKRLFGSLGCACAGTPISSE